MPDAGLPPRLPLWEWRTRIDALKSTEVALDIGAGILAAGLAGKNVPVVWWAFAPIAGAAYEGYNRFKTRNQNEVAKEKNPLLETYYSSRLGLTDANMAASHRATLDYFNLVSTRGLLEAGSATISLIGGHYHSQVGWTFNSLIHVPTSIGALYTLTRASWMMVRHLSALQRSEDEFVVNAWITGLMALKAGKAGFRIVHSLLPRFENQTILTILSAATAVRVGSSLTIGGFINSMASHIHFKAYEEQGYLVQFPLRPPMDLEAQLPARGRVAGPNSALVYMLFEDHRFRTNVNDVAGDIINDPAGWVAIAHRLTMT